MKEILKKKIDYFEGILLTRLQNQIGLNFTQQVNRDARTAFNNISYFKNWVVDYDKLNAAATQDCKKVAFSYFIENENSFNVVLSNYLTYRLTEVEPPKAVEVINEVAWVVAYEQVKAKFISHIIESCPNG